MNRKLYLACITIILCFSALSSCKKSNQEINPEFARYIAAFTSGKISSSSAIQIELTQDIPSVELGKEIDQELFDFSPSIKGKAYWTSTRSLKFVPEPGELKAGQKYDAWFKLNKVINVEKDFDKFYFKFGIPEQNFRINLLPYTQMKDNDRVWNSVSGTLNLADGADPESINKMFTLEGDDSGKARVRISQANGNGRYNIVIDSLERGDASKGYTLRVKGDPINVNKSELFPIVIPALSSFEVLDVQITYDPQECIRVTFSDPLSVNQNIMGLIKLSVTDNYTYDIQKNVLKIYIDPSSYRYNSSVDIDLYKEIKNGDQKQLDRRYSYSLAFSENKPNFKFINSGNVLPNSDNLNILFEAVNLWAVDVKVVKIFENNILGYFQSNDFGESSELRRFGRLVLKKRIRLDEDPSLKLNEWNTFPLDLSSMIKQDPGAVYRIELSMKQDYSLYSCDGTPVQSMVDAPLEQFNSITEEEEAAWDVPHGYYYDDGDYWDDYVWSERDNPCKPSYYIYKNLNTQSSIVFASNIGIIAKMGSTKNILVTLTDILTTKPLSGATVDVYNYQMQRIGGGKTDSDGFVDIAYKGGAPFVVIASNDKERGYLKVSPNLSLSLSNFDVSGVQIEKGLKGYIYGERGVWRPGDSIFVTFVLEDKANTLPKNHPVSLDLYTPKGQLYKQYMSNSGQEGFYAFRMVTDPDAITGNWQARIKVGGVTFSKTLKVETVKPNRLKIRFDAGEMIDASNGLIIGTLSSQWLHGAPASNLKANMEMTLSPVYQPFKGYEGYSFNNPTSNFHSDNYTIFNGNLDASGNANVRGILPQAASAPGMLRANIISRVFETGGDASIYTQTAAYSPYSAYIGVKSPTENDYDWLETDTDNTLDIVSVDKNGKPVSRSGINVKVYKINWSWWWNSDNDNLSSYVNSTSANVILNQTVSTDAQGKAKVKFRVDYPEWGRYLVIAKDGKGGHISGKIIYVDWPSWRGRSSKQDASGFTMLSFTTDKHSYKVGEKATVILPQSSAGNALVSIETGTGVISRTWVKTKESGDTKYSFTVTEEMAPNFYVFATLLQPHAQTINDLPLRMYGVVNVNVTNEDTRLYPQISMPDELKPEKEFTVSISEKNKKDMTYTLAIVDDGLLDLTSFKTPNAWSDFYARQALGVRTWDMFDLVVAAQSGKLGPLLSIGGDEALKPVGNTANRFKPVVKYLGPFTLKGGKTDTHKIQLPPYVGSVRTMIVAGNAKGAYGNAEKTVQVKNPLMILSTLPRVAGPGEEILLPVNVFAMDKKVKDVTVSVQSQGLFEFTDGTSKQITFGDVGDKVVFFKVKVAKKTGNEKVTIKASGGGENATETIDIEIRNPNPAVILTSQALLSANATQELNISMDAPQPEDWVRLEVSRMPGINLSRNLEYLFEYPHGCSEQVTSRAFPLLFIDNFTTFSDKEKSRIDYNIKEAIKIISARQLNDGGIAYWPGNKYPNEWVTTYAGHFLVEAQRSGREVPTTVLSKWKEFQKKAAQSWNQRDLYNSYYSYSMSDLQQAYRLYTLALAGEPELGAMNRLKEMTGITIQARWRLAAAYMLIGKKDAANQLINGISDTVNSYSYSNNTFGSSVRDMAMIMETYLLMDRVDKAMALSHKVAEYLSSDYICTQSSAYGLIAMARLAEKMGKGIIAYDWELNGVKQKSTNSGRVFEEIVIKPQEKINVQFTNKSEGQLFVRLIGRTKPFVDTTPASNKGLNLHVKYLDANGKDIDVKSLKQGTEFFASVIIQNVSGLNQTDIALTQIFASGWEIFNNRLFNESDDKVQTFSYQDIRDDRVLTYFNINTGYSMAFKVRLQAAYCGRFYLPAVTSEAMYNPEEQSRTTGQWVEVKQ